jgi:hypothetical protein
MSSPSSSTALPAAPDAPGSPQKSKMDPKLRVAMKYTLSPREYDSLHRLLVKRAPKAVSKRTPSPSAYDAELQGRDDYNASAIRASVRLFVASQAGLKLWKLVSTALLSPNTRLSLSLSLLLLFHRLLHRFSTRLRANLLTQNSQPFRKRNPRVSRALTSSLAPAVVSSLAGVALAGTPADQFRVTITIYMLTRGGEFVWNALEADGWFGNRPWWFGSWLFMPGVFGELLYAFVFGKDCFPKVRNAAFAVKLMDMLTGTSHTATSSCASQTHTSRSDPLTTLRTYLGQTRTK